MILFRVPMSSQIRHFGYASAFIPLRSCAMQQSERFPSRQGYTLLAEITDPLHPVEPMFDVKLPYIYS